MIARLLEQELAKRNMSYRAAARAMGISHTTIHRTIKGDTMDMRTIVKVCEFLGISVSDALNMSDDRDLSSRIAAILEIEPKLKEVFEEAISRVESGKASAELIHDIVLYANYKLSLGA